MYKVVLDTNVMVAAIRSRRGASFALLQQIGVSWLPLISMPLILEYEAVGKREAERLGIPVSTVDAIVTHNLRHFAGVEQFGVQVLTPREFLRKIKEEAL